MLYRSSYDAEATRLSVGDRQAALGVDFRPFPDWEYPKPFQYLVWWKRLEPGISAADERADLDRRLKDFARGVDPYRQEVEEGWPEPLTPRPRPKQRKRRGA